MTREDFIKLWEDKELSLLKSTIIKKDYFNSMLEIYRYQNIFWGVTYSISDDPQFSREFKLPWLAKDLRIKEVMPIPEIKYYIKDDPDKEFIYDL